MSLDSWPKQNTEILKTPTEKDVPAESAEIKEVPNIIKRINVPNFGEIEYIERTVLFTEKNISDTGGVIGYIERIISNETLEKIKKIDQMHHDYTYSQGKELITEILNVITNGEFPNKTFNHIMAGDDANLDDAKQFFHEEGQIMQQVFSLSALRYQYYKRSRLKVFSLEYNKKIDNFDGHDVKDIGFGMQIQLVDEILSSGNYILSTSGGIDVLGGDVWKWQSMSRSPLFGFGKKNKVFNNYISEYESILNKTDLDERSKEHALGKIRKIQSNSLNGWEGDGVGHPSIPFIVNHPDIKNLQWCHADYAAFETDHGYAVLEMITNKEEK